MNPKLKAILYECYRTKHAQDKHRNLEYYAQELLEAGLQAAEYEGAIKEVRKILNLEEI